MPPVNWSCGCLRSITESIEFYEDARIACTIIGARSRENQMATLFAIVLLGFFLGMRHATDPDHVVAVTTIVSRERTMLHAALIGALWGLGHTVTILGVGSAIILFNLTIPPRLGMSMELSVGLMLILLGVLNLTGLLRRGVAWIVDCPAWP